jgi:plasmid stabilization system protein ParE
MPAIAIGETAAICDATGAHLGDFTIYDNRIGAWLGTFSPAPAYDRVRHLFAQQAGLAATPGAGLMEEAREKIAALGLWARLGHDRLEIRDVRLYEDAHGIGGSFRQAA